MTIQTMTQTRGGESDKDDEKESTVMSGTWTQDGSKKRKSRSQRRKSKKESKKTRSQRRKKAEKAKRRRKRRNSASEQDTNPSSSSEQEKTNPSSSSESSVTPPAIETVTENIEGRPVRIPRRSEFLKVCQQQHYFSINENYILIFFFFCFLVNQRTKQPDDTKIEKSPSMFRVCSTKVSFYQSKVLFV